MPPKLVPDSGPQSFAPDSSGAVETGNATPASAAEQSPVGASPQPIIAPGSGSGSDVNVEIILVRGGITNVEGPVAVAARYDGLALAGGARAFDRLLDSWLTRALELGIVGSGLGQLFPINLEERKKLGRIKTGYLLLANMGEPGRFAQDGLRYLVSNIVVATKSLGYDEVATSLVGTRRNELPIADAIRAVMQGIVDGYERFRVIAGTVTDNRDQFRQAAHRALRLKLVDPNSEKLDRMDEVLRAIVRQNAIPGLKLDMVPPAAGSERRFPREDVNDDDAAAQSAGSDLDAEVPVTLLRITQSKAPSADKAGTFQFSGLSDLAAVPVREADINGFWLNELPGRMVKGRCPKERERLSTFFSYCMFPEDFRKLIETAPNLMLEVDEVTAQFPWEMAAHQAFSRIAFLGTNVGVSRQFRSLLSPPPTAVPPLNKTLKVLVIADPAAGDCALPHAREEGAAVVRVLDQARIAWAGIYDIAVTVRIGSKKDGDSNATLDALKGLQCISGDPKPCDPLDLAMLIVGEQFDVIHYAGHGFCDSSRRAGWVFARDCFLTAQEIFRVRQVPRLVFANACFSAVTALDVAPDAEGHREKSVGVAQAFFARGIPNYIGAGWPVDDASARECASRFYMGVLGLEGAPTAPPATIGDALRTARERTFDFKPDSSTWGAYQHYGRVGDKLLPFPNRPSDDSQ
ncbi:MAG: hypothetical protein QOF41_1716 [Methylobacteriaceae bacterium]|nr:hypothetical protein [Methylobacteriaceae bacterium]